jgi:hypothetical protein
MAKPTQNVITIEGWSAGIGASPHTGFQEMYNCDVFNVDGVVKPNFQMFSQADVPVVGTFSYPGSGNVITLSKSIERTFNSGGTGSADGMAITFSGTLPTGLTAGVVYFVIDTGSLTASVAATLDNALVGTAISLSGSSTSGSGFATLAPHLMTQFALSRESDGSHLLYGLDGTGRLWVQDASLLWYLIAGNTSAGGSSAAGNGLVFWNNYLLVFDNATISTWGPFTSVRASRGWQNSWVTLLCANTDTKTHCPFVQAARATGGTLYWGDYADTTVSSTYPVGQPFIGSLTATAGSTFDPTSSGTYTANIAALVVPLVAIQVTCLENFADQLVIGTASNRIYLWDLTSQNPTTPMFMPENNVAAMVNINSILYVSCGYKGNIYKTYGTYVQKIVDFSDYLSGYPQYTVTCSTNGMCAIQGRLFVAFTGDVSSAATPPDDQVSGIYSVNLEAGSPAQDFQPQPDAYCMEYVSSGGYGVQTGAMYAWQVPATHTGVQWPVLGWYNPNASGTPSYGVDSYATKGFIGPSRATGYLAMLASEVYVVGDSNNPRTFEKCLVTFAKPLSAGQGIQLAFRKEDVQPESLSYATVDYATYGPITYLDVPVNVENATLVQAFVQITSPGGQLLYDAPELRQLKIY